MIQIVEGLPDNVVGIVAKGRVTNEDCNKVLKPLVQRSLMRHDKVRLYYEIGCRFPGAAWEDLKTAKAAAGGAPVIAGSGVDATNLTTVLETADALIVGTGFKQDGVTTNAVESERVRTFMRAVTGLRKKLNSDRD